MSEENSENAYSNIVSLYREYCEYHNTSDTNDTDDTAIQQLIRHFEKQSYKQQILFELYEENYNNQDLAERLDVEEHIARKTTKRLKDDGLIEVKEKDGNTKIYGLTTRGQNRIKDLVKNYVKNNTSPLVQGKVRQDKKVQSWINYFESHEDISKSNSGNYKPHITTTLDHIAKFNPDLEQKIEQSPRQVLKAGKKAIAELSDKKEYAVTLEIELPDTLSFNKDISQLRQSDIGGLITVEGIIRHRTELNPLAVKRVFECPSCKNVIHIEQDTRKKKKPSKCSCGRKGKFHQIDVEYQDYRILKIEELDEDKGHVTNPESIYVELRNELTRPGRDTYLQPGSKVKVCGILDVREAKKSNNNVMLKQIDGLYIEPLDDDYSNLEIAEEDEEKFEEIKNKENPIEFLSNQVFGHIVGMDNAKKSALLQQFSNGYTKRNNGNKDRGWLNVCILGDPGTAKSDIGKRIVDIAPRSKSAQATSSSGVGLTATAQSDEMTGDYYAEAGVLGLANRGTAFIDEIDKIGEDELNSVHNAIEDGKVNLDKANVHATISTETRVLASANPEDDIVGDQNPRKQLGDVIKNKTIPDRFDLIVLAENSRSKDKTKKIADTFNEDNEIEQSDIDDQTIKKYILKSREFNPSIPSDLFEKLKELFVEIEDVKEFYRVTPRVMRTLIALAKAHARARHSDTVNKEDVRKSEELYRRVMTNPKW